VFRLRIDSPMLYHWQRRRGCRRVADPLLEETDVEDIVQFGAGRQLEADSHLIDELGDAVRPEEVGLQLPLRSHGQGRQGSLT
jgi:hypothetical protein